MDEQTIRDIDECRQPRPSISGMAAKLRETHPELNRAARQRLAREIARREQLAAYREMRDAKEKSCR